MPANDFALVTNERVAEEIARVEAARLEATQRRGYKPDPIEAPDPDLAKKQQNSITSQHYLKVLGRIQRSLAYLPTERRDELNQQFMDEGVYRDFDNHAQLLADLEAEVAPLRKAALAKRPLGTRGRKYTDSMSPNSGDGVIGGDTLSKILSREATGFYRSHEGCQHNGFKGSYER